MNSIYEQGPLSDDVKGAASSEVERAVISNGIKVYLKGHPHPVKGMPTPQAIQAINLLKKVALEFSKHPILFLRPLKALESFNEIARIATRGVIIKDEYLLPLSRELKGIIGVYGAHVFEYDNAYRLRLQDMFSSVSQKELIEDPIKTIWKMVKRNREQDYIGVHIKVRRIAWLITLGLLFSPSFHNKWKSFFKDCTYSNLCLDESDVYWIGLRSDYGPNNGNKIETL